MPGISISFALCYYAVTYLERRDWMHRRVQISARIILLGYALQLGYWMLFGFGRAAQSQYMYNIVPFATICLFIRGGTHQEVLINLLGNVGVFVPIGLLIPAATGGRLKKSLSLFWLGIMGLEILQLLTRRGIFDVDDFFLNTVGFLIGYGIYRLADRWIRPGQAA